jgi:hypothetical protein
LALSNAKAAVDFHSQRKISSAMQNDANGSQMQLIQIFRLILPHQEADAFGATSASAHQYQIGIAHNGIETHTRAEHRPPFRHPWPPRH